MYSILFDISKKENTVRYLLLHELPTADRSHKKGVTDVTPMVFKKYVYVGNEKVLMFFVTPQKCAFYIDHV
jgi:hypothetical protein